MIRSFADRATERFFRDGVCPAQWRAFEAVAARKLDMLDAAVRLLPGVMGAADSEAEESFSRHLLEYPHYTRPAEWQGRRVPEILLSGHHAAIATWRQSAAECLTRERRPDLWEAHTAETCSAPVASLATPP